MITQAIWAHLKMPDRQAGTNERLGTLFFILGHYDEARTKQTNKTKNQKKTNPPVFTKLKRRMALLGSASLP